MQVPLQITVSDVSHSEALDARIRARIDKLEQQHRDITSCRVTVKQLGRHRHKGREYRVRIELGLPGRSLVADRAHHEDPYVALRDAFDAIRGQLDEIAQRRQAPWQLVAVSQPDGEERAPDEDLS